MKPSFYIAGAFAAPARADLLADDLLSRGWRQTFRWTKLAELTDGGKAVDLRVAANWEVCGIVEADVVIALLPEAGAGTHVEIGIGLGRALAGHCWLVLWSETGREFAADTCPFYFHPVVVKMVGPIEEIGARLAAFSGIGGGARKNA
jgi:hypothetical protein